ncbi:coiled-coil domain-containing protein 190 [Cynocephalus volans]|uniref:coiled-coil domain-containing protein 190 n=1 Tax=Cynocephalus volans TaxID=110931 RepID=UPI002FCB7892
MERHVARGPLYKHFDLERKNAKQAEARLSQRVQRLEDVCLYHMKLLTREQRQLQKELQRLKQEIIKKRFSSCFGIGIQKRPEDVPVFSPQGEQKHRVPQANKIRALATDMSQEIHKTKFQMPPLWHTGHKDSTRRKEQLLSQNDRTAQEKPQAQENDSVNPPKGIDSNKGISVLCQDQEVSSDTTEHGSGSSPAGDSGMAHVDGTRSTDANLKPSGNTSNQIPPNPMECSGSFKGESTKPSFLELFAKAKHAHYLRHRVPPESERLLSIGEIFGHAESSSLRVEKECGNGAASQFLPL